MAALAVRAWVSDDMAVTTIPNLKEAAQTIVGITKKLMIAKTKSVKGDPEFAAKLNEIVEAMRADGTLSALSVKWYGVDISTVEPTS